MCCTFLQLFINYRFVLEVNSGTDFLKLCRLTQVDRCHRAELMPVNSTEDVALIIEFPPTPPLLMKDTRQKDVYLTVFLFTFNSSLNTFYTSSLNEVAQSCQSFNPANPDSDS